MRYGWVKDTKDERDRLYSVSRPIALPDHVDLRAGGPQIFDQGQASSCTGNGVAALMEFVRGKQADLPMVSLSRLMIYFNAREMEGATDQDGGAQIRDAIKSVATQGVCMETEWPYDLSKLHDKPPADCYYNGLNDKAVEYSRVPQTMQDIKTCLAEGYPVVFGATLYESFKSAQVMGDGVVPLPHSGEKVVGGHCMLMVGYYDTKPEWRAATPVPSFPAVLVRNSWGAWGYEGCAWFQWDYLLDPALTADLWTVRLVSKP